jgi:subtilisin family serine protease
MFSRKFAARRRSVIPSVLAVLLTALGVIMPVGLPPARAAGPEHAPGELLVSFQSGVTDDHAERVYHAYGAVKVEKLLKLRVHRIRVAPAALDAVESALSQRSDVEFVERNWRLAPSATMNDPLFPSEWHLTTVAAPTAWNYPQLSGVIVAVIDSGVDSTHPDLSAKLVPGYNFYDNTTNTADVFGHGTAVAGTVAAIGNNGIGVVGLAPGAQIMPMRTTDSTGYSYASAVTNAMVWAVDHGAKVLNMSIGGVAGVSTITSAAQYVRSKGGVVVAAAGNCACFDSTPENPYIISVSATVQGDGFASFSSQGNYVDISAPGDHIYTTNRGGTYGMWYGTSFASPVVAGVVALMMGANPDLGPADIEALLKANADDRGPAGWDPQYGYGRVNAARAVAAAVVAVPSDTTSPTVSITSPASGSTVSGITTVGITASDNTGVSRVDLYIDGALYASDAASPFAAAWDTTRMTDGSHTLVARAYDPVGNMAVSTTVTATVWNGGADATPPSTQIVSMWTQGNSLKVKVAAQDNVAVVKVDLYVDGALQSSSSGPTTFSVNLKNLPRGTHTLESRAYDAAGNVGTSGGGATFVK